MIFQWYDNILPQTIGCVILATMPNRTWKHMFRKLNVKSCQEKKIKIKKNINMRYWN